MKTFTLIVVLLFTDVFFAYAQSATITPGPAGNIKVPNLNYDQIAAIPNPQKGMIAYDTTLECLRVYDGTRWNCLPQDIPINKTIGSAKAFGGTTYESASAIVTDPGGNIYVSINTSAEPGPMKGSSVLLKLDQNLNIIWTKTILNASIQSICFDSQNHICIAGTFGTSITIGTTGLYPIGYNDIFVAKFNADASFFWATSFGTAQFDFVNSLTSDSNANLYVSSLWDGSPIFYTGTTTITKYDNNGNQLFNWTNIVSRQGWNVKAYGDNDGNVYIGGNFYNDYVNVGGMGVSSNPANNSSPYNCFIAKLNNNGNGLWAKNFQHIMEDFVFDQSTSTLYATGVLYGKMIYDNTIIFATGYTDIFVGKINSEGGLLWMKQMGGQTGYENRNGLGLALDNNKNVYVTGYFGGSIEFGSTSTPNIDGLDGYVAKYSSSGEPVWIERFAGTSNEQGNTIAVGKNNNVYIAGEFSGQTRFQFKPTTTNYITSAGNTDAFIALYKQLE
jgi:hypothetical protein